MYVKKVIFYIIEFTVEYLIYKH